MDYRLVGVTTWIFYLILTFDHIIQLSYVQLALLLVSLLHIPWALVELAEYKMNYMAFWTISQFNFVSFQIHQGIRSAALLLPWILLCIFVLFSNFRVPEIGDMEQILRTSSLFFMPAASTALFISRLGLHPFGFSGTIIELTAIHFHYSGVLIPLIFMHYRLNFPNVLPNLAYWIVAFGTPIVAIGITLGSLVPILGAISVSCFAGVLLLASVLVLKYNLPPDLRVAYLVFCITMMFAIYYAIGVAFPINTISIGTMIITHGIGNGLIFTTLSINGWNKFRI